ncbi:substrate-binding domain-containing protein [Amycolatopsis acidicola]|uniref:Substrate-binding domain-containing protein n=1 Tax=Amycolatopsis acidicola TaxID=2596893 RepID=A0A5N0V2C0_9PSEU|nr:substrate-binding domain-containing protein [Amycolatopsis acidicola]KAA9158715.1 substrate-binding domain-containing protein [Amycolatopsis acidicola]
MYQSRSFSLRRTATAVAAGLAVTALAACGATGPAGTSATPAADNAALSDLKKSVDQMSQALPAYPVPTDKVDGVSSLRGKTVYYIPITQQAPQFAVTATALTDALKAAGVNLQVCNGGSNPSQISACVSQATGANAGGIITDSIPYGMAANALDAARAKKIPVLITDQIPDSAHPADATLGYIQGAGGDMLKAVADWIIVDSGGTANVLINGSTDSPSTKSYVDQAKQEFSAKCPGCKVTVNEISSANYSLIASSTSSAILRTPGVNYVVSEFDQYLQPTLQGVQQSGKQTSIKGASTAAQVSGLQMLSGKNFLYVDASQASPYQGWASADAIFRLMLGKQLPTYTIPQRLFTRDNVSTVSTDAAAEGTGSWHGPADFPDKFKALWGVSQG